MVDKDELMNLNDDELEDLMNEHTDDSDLFPNGRDEDAEDEDGI